MTNTILHTDRCFCIVGIDELANQDKHRAVCTIWRGRSARLTITIRRKRERDAKRAMVQDLKDVHEAIGVVLAEMEKKS